MLDPQHPKVVSRRAIRSVSHDSPFNAAAFQAMEEMGLIKVIEDLPEHTGREK